MKGKRRMLGTLAVSVLSVALTGFPYGTDTVLAKGNVQQNTSAANYTKENIVFTKENIGLKAGVASVLEQAIQLTPLQETDSLEALTRTVSQNSLETENQEEEIVNTLMIADVTYYVNIRDQASTEGEIVGKLYDNSVGTLLSVCDDWYQIQSGSVTGYVKAEYVLTGAEGQARADEVGERLAKVGTTTLKVRQEAGVDSIVLGLVPEGDILSVQEETEGWVKVSVEEGEGYVSTDYVEVYTKNVEAESVEEERIRLEKEEAERKKAEEAARKALEEKKAAEKAAKKKAAAKTAAAGSSSTSSKKQEAQSSTPAQSQTNQAAGGDSALGQQIADYAQQFIGNPYVYGGTSLTKGADCSGFVMSVYANYGISLPRTSGEQGASGSSVGSIDNAIPGDLVWYSGHIGIYIGNGKLVHASNKKEGIKVSEATYRKILGVRRIV